LINNSKKRGKHLSGGPSGIEIFGTFR